MFIKIKAGAMIYEIKKSVEKKKNESDNDYLGPGLWENV